MLEQNYQTTQLAIAPTPHHDEHHPIVVVGAGPVGLGMAIDLALRGQPVVVLDDDNQFSVGSRAICFAKRTLDVWDRLGVADRMVQKGVAWNVGKVFFRDEEVWNFNLLPEPLHQRPAFINLQQYYCEAFLYERALELGIDIRSKHKVVDIENHPTQASLSVTTPDGAYTLHADWLIACDGARSPIRKAIGQSSQGRIFQDRFLIADIRTKVSYPAERWFWFDPPFHPNQSVLLHSQPDDVWRIDFQLGWDADPIEEVKEENVRPRVQALLGDDIEFDFEWISIYTFACERMDTFRFNRILFAGDSAHRVSPFGARGANSGIQDTDNLAWKLDLHLRGLAPESLLDSYCQERGYAADENIAHSSRATDFITPKSDISLLFRNTTLRLAKELPFARSLVNSGRLSLPSTYTDSPLNTADQESFSGSIGVGGSAVDAPLQQQGNDVWWLSQLGSSFSLVLFDPSPKQQQEAQALQHALLNIVVIRSTESMSSVTDAETTDLVDHMKTWQQRYDAQAGSCYLFRPDQHLTARWRHLDNDQVQHALHRACGVSSKEAIC